MKTLINQATNGKDAERNELYCLLNEQNSIVAEKLTKDQATAKLSKGLRLDRGWTEGGYRVVVGVSKVLLANDWCEQPDWKVKAEVWVPTYNLAVQIANAFCAA